MHLENPLYYHCYHSPDIDRYGLIRQKDNSFYIVDNDPELLKNVQLVLSKYELLHFVNIDHFFNFIEKTNNIVDTINIQSLTEQHNYHISNAAVNINKDRKQVQQNINNDNCFLFGLSLNTIRALHIDVNHFRLIDNVIQHKHKNDLFDEDVQEKAFLIRRLLYVLKHTNAYLRQFFSLQESIGNFGMSVTKKFFKICNPEDTVIPKLIEEEVETNNRRFESFNTFSQMIFKSINELDLSKSIKNILVDFIEILESGRKIEDDSKKFNKKYNRYYDMHRIKTIVKNDCEKILKHYN